MGILTNVQGRKKVLDVIVAHCSKLCILSYIIGIIWLCALSDPSFNARVYFSENALLPGLVEAEYKDHKLASSLFQELLHVPQDDLSNPASYNWLLDKMEDIGLHTYHQNFTVHLPFPDSQEPQTFDGMNVYGILRAPRIAGTEAVVISVPYNKGHNRGALALMLSFAWHCRKKDYWSKDIIFVVTDKAELGMQAWLDAYHGVPNFYISSAPLQGYSGSIQAALNLEFDMEKVSFFKILIEGVNGQLPNLDLVNTVFRLCRQQGIPAALHTEGYHRNLGHWGDSMHSLVSMVMMMFYQASGRPSGNHGLFHRYRIEALTMRGGEDGRYGHSFLETGKVIEGIFRSLNNLLEQFHQSFFFYLLPESHRYVSIGLYMPPFGCLLVGPLVMAVVLWSQACSGPAAVTTSEPQQEEAAASEDKDGQNIDGDGQNIEGYGQNVDGDGQNIEGYGQNVDGDGQNIEGYGQNVDEDGQNIEGHGQNVDGEGQNVHGNGQNVHGNGKNVHGNGQNMDGDGKNVESHGQNEEVTDDRQDTLISNETPVLEDKVAFLRYPHNIASVVPVVMATHVGGALVFYSPDVGYKAGEIIGADPLSCAFGGIFATFVALVLFPFVTRCSSEDVPDHVTTRNQCMLKCAALVLFSVIISTLAAINFSLAFLVSMFLVPVFLFVVPTRRRSRRAVQAFLLLLVSPPMILFLLSLAFNTLVFDGNFDSSDLLSVTMDTVRGCVTSSVREARMLGTWSYAMTCLGILPNWLLFWYVAWQ